MNNGADEEMVDHIRRLIEAGLSRELDMPLSLDACVPASTLDAFLERLAAYVTERRVQEAFSNGDAPGDNGDPSEQHPRNRLNDLTGAEWLWFTKSVMRTTYPSILGHEIRKRQGGNKPPQLMQELIEFFSKRGDLVLDPFGGSGTTLVTAKKLGRQFVGFELSENYVTQIEARLAAVNAGDPLVGAENPLTTAPNTADGRRLDASANGGKRTRRKRNGRNQDASAGDATLPA